MSPFGVVRKPQDRPEYGHSGIDVPLLEGAAILAVADGTIISILPAANKFPGEIVLLLIMRGDREGEG
jgi:murein DD-endopeptidase MepM/ murein hydrolase activator NlpD